jgi:formylglycine-generating enzyme required for sulfatase activity
VLRGSSWFSHVRGGLLSSYRARHKPSFREDNYLGFRCVLEFPSETSNAPLKPAQNSTTVGPQLSEEMTLASARGGKLRAWGNFGAKDDQGGLRTIDISKADRYSDFVAVAGDGGILAALRKNKTLLAFEANDQAQTSFERDEVTGLFRDRVWPRYQVGGSLFHRGTLPTVTIKSPAPPLRALASFFHIRESGFVCIPEAGSPFWVPAPGTPAEKSSPPPSDLLQEATDAVGISSAIGVVSKAGRLRIWTPEKKVIETPSQYSDIVEIRGGGNFAVCRKRDGSVLVWPPAGHKEGWLPDPSVQRVPSLPPAVQVRCDLYVCAAQMTDGRWIGWGADAEVVAKISEIGKATDLAIAGLPADNRKPEKARYVVWIEPLPAETATLTANLPPELAALDTQFKALEKERVTSPYETALAKLNTGYLSSLQKAVTAEKAAGRQSGALALEAEQKRLAAAGSSASAVLGDEDDATAPLVLRNLRTIWRAEHARLLAVRATSLKALVDPLETRLAALEAEFAKANRQADSTKVRTHRDGLGKSLAEASSAAQAAALKAKTSADESPERACARWAVGLSGEVWKAGATSPLKSEADIPKTDFKIEKLVLNDGTAKKGAVSGMDMGRLDGLKGLRWLDVRGQPIGEAGVAKLETLDALETLDLHDCNLTDASLRVISRFRKLTRLDVGNNKDITDQGAAHLSSLTQLEWLNIYGSGVTDQTLTGVLASLPKLKYVEIHGTQVTLLGARAFLKSKPDCLLNAGSTSSATAPKSAPSTPQAATLDPSKGYTNTLGMKFMPVPGLKVMFCIHETRRQDYAAFAKEATGVSDSWKNMKIEDIPCGDQDDHPVVGVSTEDAVKFCQWLSAKEGMTYRLPTDAEWSDAVGLRGLENPDYIPERKHAKVEDIYPWEGSYPPKTTDQAGNYADMLWHREFLRRPYISNYRDGYVTTAPVMSYRPNLYGLYDMGGNVWEWVEDLWTKEKGQTDGVLRGGAFDREAVLSSFRYRYRQQWVPSLYAVGFRVVMVVK